MRYLVFLICLILMHSCVQLNPTQHGSTPVSHKIWDRLLIEYVSEEGLVDYEGLRKDTTILKSYLRLLSQNAPDSGWTREEKLAYWINAYNAFTIDLILKHYPVSSIKDIGSMIQIPFINSPWDIKFIEIAGEKYDLNNLEHNILRQNWHEPRIHFAINCASFSCPRLRNEAYTAEKLEIQLEEQTMAFINDDFRNDINPQVAQLSKIFSWFSGDFEKNGTIQGFINQYAIQKITAETDISFKPYDWRLNIQSK